MAIVMAILVGFLIPLVGIAYEMRLRRKMDKEQRKAEEARADREFELLQEKVRRELDHLDYRRMTVGEMAVPLSKEIIHHLTENSNWLREVFRHEWLGNSNLSNTIFGRRLAHFQNEKRFLADEFVPLLLERCKMHINSGKKVYLVIDSGTTLYYFMEVLSRLIVKKTTNEQEAFWGDESCFTVVTNNLAGVDIAMETGRTNKENRFENLAYHCFVLPGKTLPIYSAVTGKITTDTLKRFKTDADPEKSVFIGLAVGNWVRIRNTPAKCPLPMARAEGHLDFKQVLIELSDEVFIITPLAKVIKGKSLDEVNRLICSPGEEVYKEVYIENGHLFTNPEKVKLITTTRKRNRELFSHASKLEGLLSAESEQMETYCAQLVREPDIAKVSHLLFKFDYLPNDKLGQIEVEFPHPETRQPRIMQELYQVT